MLKRREQTLTLRTAERCQGFSMRHLLPSDAGGACPLLYAWLSTTYSKDFPEGVRKQSRTRDPHNYQAAVHRPAGRP